MSPLSAATAPDLQWPDRVAWAVLSIVSLIAALTFRHYGLGWDDYTHSQYADLLLAFYGSGFADKRALEFVNLYLYGGGFDMAAALLAKILPFDLFETRRLAGAIVGIAGLAVTWRIARRIGGPLAGLIALALLATCPLYYGHMFINPKDAPFAVAMAVFLLGLVRALEEFPKPSAVTLAILGLGFGCAIGSRIMAGFGVIAALAAFAVILISEARVSGLQAASRRLGLGILRLWPAAVLAYATMALLWPWAVVDPLNPIKAIGVFAHFFEKPWQELFDGMLLTPPEMPRRYVPELTLRQLPEVFTVLAATGTLISLYAAACKDMTPQRRAIEVCVLVSAALPVIIAVLTRPAMYNGIRHFVFVLPPLAVIAGLAGSRLIRRAGSFGGVAWSASIAVIVAGLVIPIIGMVRLHPYQYLSFNTVTGGIKAARPAFMLDYWGLSFKQAATALKASLAERGETPPEGRKWKIAVCGPHPGAQVALGDAFEPTWDPKGADFALSLGEFYCAPLNAPVLATIERAGVVLARAYDLRGREVPTLFTIPPIERDPPTR